MPKTQWETIMLCDGALRGSIEHMATRDPRREELGNYIRSIREEKNLTQTQLAERMAEALGTGIYQTTVGRIENGDRALSLSEAAVLADTLNVPISSLASMASPTTPETRRQNYAHKIMDAVNHLVTAESAIRTVRRTAEDLESLPPEQVDGGEPKAQRALAGLPGEIFAYERAEESVHAHMDTIHEFWASWMFAGLNDEYVEVDEQDNA